jgi:hypothetical protein
MNIDCELIFKKDENEIKRAEEYNQQFQREWIENTNYVFAKEYCPHGKMANKTGLVKCGFYKYYRLL